MSFQCFDFFKNFGKAVERLSATRREMWRGGGIGAGMEAMREEEIRGEWRQRDRRLVAAQVCDAISHRAAGHLKQHADGESSTTQLRYHTANAVRNGMAHPTIVRPAAIAEGGGNPQRGFKALPRREGRAAGATDRTEGK